MGNSKIVGYSVKDRNKIITVPEGMTILSEGEVNLDMYKIISGNVEMYTGYGTKNEVLIGILGPGACFGEFGILLHKPAIYTIVTFSEVRLLRVTEGALGNFVQENQDSVIQIMRNMANMMMTMMHNVDQMSLEFDEMLKKIATSENNAPNADSASAAAKADAKTTDTAAKPTNQEKVQQEKKNVLRACAGAYRFKFMDKYNTNGLQSSSKL